MEQTASLKSQLNDIVAEVAKVKNIVNYKVKMDLNMQIGDGFAGHFYMADVVDKDSNQVIQIAIKKSPGINFNYNPVFKNEIIFYTKIYPTLAALQKTVHLPRPFNNVPDFLSSNLEPKKEYLAMENLKKQGFVLHDKQKYLDREHLNFIFDVYGRFHALSFVLKKKDYTTFKKYHEGLTHIFDKFFDESAKMFEDCMSSAVEALDHQSVVYEELKDLPKYTIPTLKKAIQYTGQYSCTTHGDCWSNNMMFKYSESGKLIDMKFVDFQLTRETSLIHDLFYFFYSGTSKTDMDILEDYLKIYYKSFSEVIEHFGEKVEEIMSYSTLLSEWKENALLGTFLGVYLWQIKLLPAQEYVDDLKKASDDGDNADKLMKLFEKVRFTTQSPAFKERAAAVLIHSYEFGVIGRDKIVRKQVEEKVEPKPTDARS
ncbi:uncharacterized protein [Euwallacea similis]|uniref:uncharacterized protein isoform X2 n=1 Tax=Euwallacea similis TaxID=1736056 RepID=UPI00344B7903